MFLLVTAASARTIAPESTNDFHQILTDSLSTGNNVWQTAEEIYQFLPLELRLLYLFSAVQNHSTDVNEKQEAAVMLLQLMENAFVEFISIHVLL